LTLQDTLISHLKLLLLLELLTELLLLSIVLKESVSKLKLSYVKVWPKKLDQFLWLTKLIDKFLNYKMMLKVCIKTSSELLIWLMSLSLVMNNQKWEISSFTQIKVMLLSVQEKNVGLSLWPDLLKFMLKNSRLKKRKWWKNFGEIIILMPKPKNGRKTKLLMMEQSLKEVSAHSLWNQSLNLQDLSWKETLNKWTKS